MFKHEDRRRTLVEMSPGTFKACKAVVVKEFSILGNHFHRHKEERFLLIHGHAKRVQIGDDEWRDIAAPYEWEVPRGKFHVFELAAGSIMIGTATEEFNPEDENADTN